MKSKWLIISMAIVLSIAMVVSFSSAGCKKEEKAEYEGWKTGETAKEGTELKIVWAQWAPSDYLQKLSEGFTEETGIKVTVEQIPWETFVQKYNAEMVAKNATWDIIMVIARMQEQWQQAAIM